MRYTLKDYQAAATNDLVRSLRRATRDYDADPNEFWSVALSAPTGAGKTVASAVIEALFDGGGGREDPLATVLWVTDDLRLTSRPRGT